MARKITKLGASVAVLAAGRRRSVGHSRGGVEHVDDAGPRSAAGR